MFSLLGQPSQLCDGISRREVLRAGGLSVLGLSLPGLLRASDKAAMGILPTDKVFGRAKSIIFLWLAGGPPQHETFDPKPNAPLEIRGPFKPISTNVPGIHFCELLPRTAAMADKLAIIRSLSTNDNTHDSSGYWLWTGYKYQGPNSRTIQPTDWPYFGSLVKRLKPSDTLPPPFSGLATRYGAAERECDAGRADRRHFGAGMGRRSVCRRPIDCKLPG